MSRFRRPASGEADLGTYSTSFEDGVWRIWRDVPGFDQRFSAAVGGDEFDGTFELAQTPGDWREDIRITYRRAG